jgi:hypothetical protein
MVRRLVIGTIVAATLAGGILVVGARPAQAQMGSDIRPGTAPYALTIGIPQGVPVEITQGPGPATPETGTIAAAFRGPGAGARAGATSTPGAAR